MTSPAHIRSQILSLNSIKNDLLIENKQLKDEVAQLQHELKKDSLHIRKELDSDLKSIFKSCSKDVSPFMKLVWSEQQKYHQRKLDIILPSSVYVCLWQQGLQLHTNKCDMKI